MIPGQTLAVEGLFYSEKTLVGLCGRFANPLSKIVGALSKWKSR
jgi:hypothetical protein